MVVLTADVFQLFIKFSQIYNIYIRRDTSGFSGNFHFRHWFEVYSFPLLRQEVSRFICGVSYKHIELPAGTPGTRRTGPFFICVFLLLRISVDKETKRPYERCCLLLLSLH